MTGGCSGVAKWQGTEGARHYRKPSPSTVTGNGAKRKPAEGFLRCVTARPEERDAGKDAATSVGMTGGRWGATSAVMTVWAEMRREELRSANVRTCERAEGRKGGRAEGRKGGRGMRGYSSGVLATFRTARKASWGMSTRPTRFMRRLPSFCFSRSLRLREMSPP